MRCIATGRTIERLDHDSVVGFRWACGGHWPQSSAIIRNKFLSKYNTVAV